jgi:hypothetical protein
MDVLLAKSITTLLSTGFMMAAIVAAIVLSFYWEGLHVGADGVYLI